MHRAFIHEIKIECTQNDFASYFEVQNSWVTKSSNETELRKMTSHFKLLTRRFWLKFFFRVTNSTSKNIKVNFELLTRKFNFYYSTFELLTRSWKTKSCNTSYWLEVGKYLISFRVTNSRLKNKKNHFELLTRWVHFSLLTF